MQRHQIARSIIVVGLAGGALGACSTPNYTVDDGRAELLEQTDLSNEQADCVIDAIEARYAEEYRSLQKANGIAEINEQAEEVYVKNRLASTTDLDAADRRAMDEIVADCTGGR